MSPELEPYHHSSKNRFTLAVNVGRTISVDSCSAMDDHFDQIPGEFDFSILGLAAASRRGSMQPGYLKAWRVRLRTNERELRQTMADAIAAGLDPNAVI